MEKGVNISNMSNKICMCCKKPLNKSQWAIINEQKYKSCPSCSTQNGNEHVYYKYPDSFGITSKRSTSIHPDGPQSYCVPCRGKGESSIEGILCSDI